MKRIRLFTLAAIGLAAFAPSVQASNTVTLNGATYINQGLVGTGTLPADMRDQFGETFGSFSALSLQRETWRRYPNGVYAGILFAQPDRGYNAAYTTNYSPRLNKLCVGFVPMPGGSTTQEQVVIKLVDTIKYTEPNGTFLTALDPMASGYATRDGFPPLPQAYNGLLSIDPEGLVRFPDGSFCIADEYGPYLYHFSGSGRLLHAIRPPAAFTPIRNGEVSFSSNTPGANQPVPSPTNPVTGRQNNQGLEGLTLSPDGKTLFVLFQSATRQDGGTGSSGPRLNTRMLAYDLSNGFAAATLKGEYVVRLPAFVDGTATKYAAQSELLALSNTQFLMLARDSYGLGTATPTSICRGVFIVDLKGASNIAGTKYDLPENPISPAGILDPAITPATTTLLVDINDPAELAKFGLTNGPENNANNLSEKWESLALVPVLERAAPNDWFLFVGNDNDFATQNGYQDGQAYNAGLENATRVLVYRLTLKLR